LNHTFGSIADRKSAVGTLDSFGIVLLFGFYFGFLFCFIDFFCYVELLIWLVAFHLLITPH